jgi:hypothetical protein
LKKWGLKFLFLFPFILGGGETCRETVEINFFSPDCTTPPSPDNFTFLIDRGSNDLIVAKAAPNPLVGLVSAAAAVPISCFGFFCPLLNLQHLFSDFHPCFILRHRPTMTSPKTQIIEKIKA